MSSDIPSGIAVDNSVCLVCPTGGFQQVWWQVLTSVPFMKGWWQPVGMKMLPSAYIEQAIYWGCRLCAACQPPGCCIFSHEPSKNLFLHFGHNETGYGGAISVRNSGYNTGNICQKMQKCQVIISHRYQQPSAPKRKKKSLLYYRRPEENV